MKWLDLPPVWTLAAIVLAGGLSQWAPLLRFQTPGGWVLPALIAAGAILLTVWTAWTLHKGATTVVPHMPPSALVTNGPLAVSRNPIYLADLALLFAAVLWFGGLSGCLLLPALWLVLTRRFVEPEESRLAEAFPDAFSAYCARVRRWI